MWNWDSGTRQCTTIGIHWIDRTAINTNNAATAINKCKPLISIMLRRAPFLKLAAVQAPDYTNQCARTARTVQVQIHPQHSPWAIIIKLFSFVCRLCSVVSPLLPHSLFTFILLLFFCVKTAPSGNAVFHRLPFSPGQRLKDAEALLHNQGQNRW